MRHRHWLIPLVFVALAIVLVVAGIGWAVVTGIAIPDQNPTPAMRAYAQFHGKIVDVMLRAGCVSLIAAVLVIGSVVGAAVAAVVAPHIATHFMKHWPQHGKWGINPHPVNCPRYGTQAPKARLPNSFRQAMWGGWTCNSCGCEMDKYGKPLGKVP